VKTICKLVLQIALFAVPLLSVTQGSAHATEITFLCAAALESWMTEVIPEFQKTSGYDVRPTFQIINVITERVRNGDAADLALVSPQQWEDLSKERKLDSSVRTVIAKVGYGVFVKKGAARPDISTVKALRRALLNASSIATFNSALGRGSPTVIYVARLFDRLGISDELKPKLKYPTRQGTPPQPVSTPLFELVANGQAEIGVAQISETLQAPGVELVGPMPVDIQEFTIFTTAIPANGKEPAAAKALIDFLASQKATSTLKSKGLEPG
jgi:molybdate transport system substrate-binding protein